MKYTLSDEKTNQMGVLYQLLQKNDSFVECPITPTTPIPNTITQKLDFVRSPCTTACRLFKKATRTLKHNDIIVNGCICLAYPNSFIELEVGKEKNKLRLCLKKN